MIRRTCAALMISGALVLGGLSAPAASARTMGFCGDIKGMASSIKGSGSSPGIKEFAKIDAVYKKLEGKAPGSVKKDIKVIRGYLKTLASVNVKKPADYAALSKKLDYKKLTAASTRFSGWAGPYLAKSCKIDINKTP